MAIQGCARRGLAQGHGRSTHQGPGHSIRRQATHLRRLPSHRRRLTTAHATRVAYAWGGMESTPGDLRSFFGATESAILIGAIVVMFLLLGIAGLVTGRARTRAGGLI